MLRLTSKRHKALYSIYKTPFLHGTRTVNNKFIPTKESYQIRCNSSKHDGGLCDKCRNFVDQYLTQRKPTSPTRKDILAQKEHCEQCHRIIAKIFPDQEIGTNNSEVFKSTEHLRPNVVHYKGVKDGTEEIESKNEVSMKVDERSLDRETAMSSNANAVLNASIEHRSSNNSEGTEVMEKHSKVKEVRGNKTKLGENRTGKARSTVINEEINMELENLSNAKENRNANVKQSENIIKQVENIEPTVAATENLNDQKSKSNKNNRVGIKNTFNELKVDVREELTLQDIPKEATLKAVPDIDRTNEENRVRAKTINLAHLTNIKKAINEADDKNPELAEDKNVLEPNDIKQEKLDVQLPLKNEQLKSADNIKAQKRKEESIKVNDSIETVKSIPKETISNEIEQIKTVNVSKTAEVVNEAAIKQNIDQIHNEKEKTIKATKSKSTPHKSRRGLKEKAKISPPIAIDSMPEQEIEITKTGVKHLEELKREQNSSKMVAENKRTQSEKEELKAKISHEAVKEQRAKQKEELQEERMEVKSEKAKPIEIGNGLEDLQEIKPVKDDSSKVAPSKEDNKDVQKEELRRGKQRRRGSKSQLQERIKESEQSDIDNEKTSHKKNRIAKYQSMKENFENELFELKKFGSVKENNIQKNIEHPEFRKTIDIEQVQFDQPDIQDKAEKFAPRKLVLNLTINDDKLVKQADSQPDAKPEQIERKDPTTTQNVNFTETNINLDVVRKNVDSKVLSKDAHIDYYDKDPLPPTEKKKKPNKFKPNIPIVQPSLQRKPDKKQEDNLHSGFKIDGDHPKFYPSDFNLAFVEQKPLLTQKENALANVNSVNSAEVMKERPREKALVKDNLTSYPKLKKRGRLVPLKRNVVEIKTTQKVNIADVWTRQLEGLLLTDPLPTLDYKKITLNEMLRLVRERNRILYIREQFFNTNLCSDVKSMQETCKRSCKKPRTPQCPRPPIQPQAPPCGLPPCQTPRSPCTPPCEPQKRKLSSFSIWTKIFTDFLWPNTDENCGENNVVLVSTAPVPAIEDGEFGNDSSSEEGTKLSCIEFLEKCFAQKLEDILFVNNLR